jgi:hypothetical protein
VVYQIFIRQCWFAADYQPAADANLEATRQFRTRNDLNETQQTRSKTNKSTANPTKLTAILSLITVWLQVRVLPGPPVKSIVPTL